MYIPHPLNGANYGSLPEFPGDLTLLLPGDPVKYLAGTGIENWQNTESFS
jgi:hypothetical protein